MELNKAEKEYAVTCDSLQSNRDLIERDPMYYDKLLREMYLARDAYFALLAQQCLPGETRPEDLDANGYCIQ